MPYQSLLVVFLSLWSVTAALPAQIVVESEPNNSSALAQSIVAGSQVECQLSAGDVDWFSFSLSTASNVAMFLSSGAVLDTRLELYESTGTILLAFDDDARDLLSDITINLNPGNYLLKIVGSGVVGTEDYTLDLAARPSKPFTGAEVEPNDLQSQAYVLPASFCRESIQAQLGSSADEDWYRLTLSAPRSGVRMIISAGDSPSATQHRYEIRDLNGPVAAALGTSSADSLAKSSNNDQLRCWPAGTYFIVVKNRSSLLASPAMSWPSSYRLTIYVAPMNTGGSVAETSEPNNLLATPIAPGQRGFGNLLGSGNDVDYWGPISGGNYSTLIVQTRPGATSPLGDSILRIVDANGSPLRTPKGEPVPPTDDGNLLDGINHARLWAVVDPGDFYIEVRGGGGPGNTGNYELEIGRAPCAPVSAANLKRFNNSACLGSTGQTVLLSTPNPWELPVLGSTYVREARNMVSSTLGVLIQDFVEIPAPIDMSPFGAPNCFLAVNTVVVSPFFADLVGSASFPWTLPTAPALLGATVFAQVVALDFTANPGGFTLSNTFGFAVGEQSY